MNINVLRLIAGLAVIACVITTGCLEDVVKGNLIIEGKVEILEEMGLFTYNLVIGVVINGPANYDVFSFKLNDAEGNTKLHEDVEYIGLDGSTIQFIDYAGDEMEVDVGDLFTIVSIHNCTGGRLWAYHSGDEVGDFDL